MTATAIEKDQEQGNERAEGRTGIKAEGGGRADLGSDHVSMEGGSLGLQVAGRGMKRCSCSATQPYSPHVRMRRARWAELTVRETETRSGL